MTDGETRANDDSADDHGMAELTTTSVDLDEDKFAIEDGETADDVAAEDDPDPSALGSRHRVAWSRVVSFGVIPALALVLFLGAGYLKWLDTTTRDAQTAAVQSVQAARDSTIALLSYTPADVDQKLGAARDLLTGQFRDSYTSLTTDVVIPGAKQQKITAVATVPAASSVSASVDHAVVLVFVDQTTTIGAGAPTALASTLRVTLDKVSGRWLISQFDPV